MSNDRKIYGNKKIFEDLKKQLTVLQNEGIEIVVRGNQFKIYLITTLILGDNLGLNSILGWVESFNLTRCCRVCYAGPEVIKSQTKESPILLRAKESYEEHVKTCNYPDSGIKEECTFNDLPNFHVISNFCLDLMHDVFEGVSVYFMAELLLHLVCVEKAFTINWLNNLLKEMDFDFESSDVPISIDIDYLKKIEN